MTATITQKYGTLLTPAGKRAIAAAVATGGSVDITFVALGDGGGFEYYPAEAQEDLKKQVYQDQANSVYIDENNPNRVCVEMIIPETVGGFTIREAAIRTADGTTIAIGTCPSYYKPILEEGAATAVGYKFILEVSNADVVALKIDSSMVYATIQHVANVVGNHARQTNAHGGTYEKTPSRLMLRNKDGRCQVEDPIDPADATPMRWVEKATAKSGGILPWSAATTYSPLPWIVWGSDNMVYVAIQPSGPGVSAGAQDPTNMAGYWQTFSEYIGAGSGGGGTIIVNGQSVGSIFWHGGVNPPSGAFVCDGSAVSRATYADLFAVIGTTFGPGDGANTFNLPDLRGEFVRGIDNNRGVDPGRVFGTTQDDATDPSTLTLTGSATSAGKFWTGQFNNNGNINFSLQLGQTNYPRLENVDISTTGMILGSTTGATETRPVNIALLPCIQWKNQSTGGTSTSGTVFPGAYHAFFLSAPPENWRVRNGAKITNASTVFPQLVAALQTAQFEFSLVDEATWQSMSSSAGGVGGVPKFVLDLTTDSVRLPDTRGDYTEHAGFNGFAVGDWHGDAIRNITGSWAATVLPGQTAAELLNPGTGAGSVIVTSGVANATFRPGLLTAERGSGADIVVTAFGINASQQVPIASTNQPKAFGVLGCVYIGSPAV